VIASVRDRQHAERDRDRGASARPARGPGLVVGVQRRPEDRVVGLRAEAEFGHVRLADQDGAARAHPFDHGRVRVGDGIGEDRRPLRVRETGCGREILDGLRNAVQGAAAAASRNLFVPLARFGQQGIAIPQGHDGVDDRVEPLDPGERRRHHVRAGHLPVGDGLDESDEAQVG